MGATPGVQWLAQGPPVPRQRRSGTRRTTSGMSARPRRTRRHPSSTRSTLIRRPPYSSNRLNGRADVRLFGSGRVQVERGRSQFYLRSEKVQLNGARIIDPRICRSTQIFEKSCNANRQPGHLSPSSEIRPRPQDSAAKERQARTVGNNPHLGSDVFQDTLPTDTYLRSETLRPPQRSTQNNQSNNQIQQPGCEIREV